MNRIETVWDLEAEEPLGVGVDGTPFRDNERICLMWPSGQMTIVHVQMRSPLSFFVVVEHEQAPATVELDTRFRARRV